MSANTKIEWADATVNWWAGCTAISPACDHCYAKTMAGRLWGVQWGPGQQRYQFAGAADTLRALDRKAKRLGQPLRVFHNSLSDMFDNEVPDTWRMDAFQAMAQTPSLIHMVLTKRIGNVPPYLQRDGLAFDLIGSGRVWLGATICNQEEADRDIPKLLAVPAAKRFLSMEPLLGSVDLAAHVAPPSLPFLQPGTPLCNDLPSAVGCARTDRPHYPGEFGCRWSKINNGGSLPTLYWVIVGGESGPGARPMHPDWVRSLRDQCQGAGVPFFFKQWGGWLPKGQMTTSVGAVVVPFHTFADGTITAMIGKKAAGRLLDGVEHNGCPS